MPVQRVPNLRAALSGTITQVALVGIIFREGGEVDIYLRLERQRELPLYVVARLQTAWIAFAPSASSGVARSAP